MTGSKSINGGLPMFHTLFELISIGTFIAAVAVFAIVVGG
jgi:hypothetical protein